MKTSTRKLLLAAIACALFTPASNAAQSTRLAADRQLAAKARKACSGHEYPNGARIVINYAGGWFRCEERDERPRHRWRFRHRK